MILLLVSLVVLTPAALGLPGYVNWGTGCPSLCYVLISAPPALPGLKFPFPLDLEGSPWRNGLLKVLGTCGLVLCVINAPPLGGSVYRRSVMDGSQTQSKGRKGYHRSPSPPWSSAGFIQPSRLPLIASNTPGDSAASLGVFSYLSLRFKVPRVQWFMPFPGQVVINHAGKGPTTWHKSGEGSSNNSLWAHRRSLCVVDVQGLALFWTEHDEQGGRPLCPSAWPCLPLYGLSPTGQIKRESSIGWWCWALEGLSAHRKVGGWACSFFI